MTINADDLNPVEKGFLHGVVTGLIHANSGLDSFDCGMVAGNIAATIPLTDREKEYYSNLVAKYVAK